jgi:HEAT repeat protein
MRINVNEAIKFMEAHGGNNYRVDQHAQDEEKSYNDNKRMDVNNDGSITLTEYLDAKFNVLNPYPTTPLTPEESEALGLLDYIDTLLNSKNASTRFAAVEKLKSADPKIVFRPLVEALKDPEASIRIAVIRALIKIKDKRAAEHLVTHLNDRSQTVRFEIVKALEVLGHEGIADKLTEFLDKETHLETKLEMIWLLGDLKSNRTLDALTKLLKHPVPAVKRAAALALIRISDSKAVLPHIIERAKKMLIGPLPEKYPDHLDKNPYKTRVRPKKIRRQPAQPKPKKPGQTSRARPGNWRSSMGF